mmetsp:Transcript_21542/g.30818  ORF Transcript_21542/g.30818 Transcript_21542/m.30818 type:complete len:188 (+) Transcript_21542:100-663(+)
MMDSNSAPATPVEENTTAGEQDPWATLAAAAGEEVPAEATAESESSSTPSTEPISVSHAEGETFTMPETAAPPSQKNEFLTAVSNLGSVISAKAQEVDQQHQVSEKLANVTEATKKKTGEINDKYQVSEKWSNLTRTVSVKVEQVKENPKTQEATENVKKSLAGATSWMSQKFSQLKTPSNNGGSNQ